MRDMTRFLAVLAIGAASVFASGLPASAADPTCTEESAGYGASEVCVVRVAQADPICPADTLQLQYVVTAEGTEATTVDLHWLNPGGTDVVQTGQPFTGTVNWPTSIPQKATEVQFVVGTDVVVNVDPTAALETCASPPTSESGVLALTGSEPLPYALAAGGLLFVGTALVLVRSARSRRAVQ